LKNRECDSLLLTYERQNQKGGGGEKGKKKKGGKGKRKERVPRQLSQGKALPIQFLKSWSEKKKAGGKRKGKEKKRGKGRGKNGLTKKNALLLIVGKANLGSRREGKRGGGEGGKRFCFFSRRLALYLFPSDKEGSKK